jgi:quinol monooxygenase YgiN
MILLKASFSTEPGNREAVLAALNDLRDAALRMDGCRGFEVLEEPRHPGMLTVVEEWRDAASLHAHESSAPVAGFKERTGDLIVQQGPTRVFEVGRETSLPGGAFPYQPQG